MFGALSLGMGMGRGAARSPFADHEFALDFKRGVYRSGGGIATSPDALPGYSFARTGASYEIGADGLPLLIPSGALPIVPGVGYWARGSMTNIQTYSDTTSNAGWGVIGASKTAGQAGFIGSDAMLSVCDGSSNVHQDYAPTQNFTSGTTYTFVRLIKPVSASRIQLTGPAGAFGTSQYANFGLTGPGSVLQAVGGTARIFARANGWYQLELTVAATTTASVSGGVLCAITSDTATRAPVNTSADSWLTQGAGNYAIAASCLPIIVTGASAATVTAADMRFTQPIPVDEDCAFWATCDFKAAAVSGQYQRLATYSNGTIVERLVLGRTDVGELSLVSVNSGAFTGSAGGSQAGAGRATVLFHRNAGSMKGGGKNSSGVVTLGGSTPLALPTGLNHLDIGNALGSAHANAPIEFIGFRRGTFSDAAITAILEAA